MKLTLLGAGVRSPLFVAAALRRDSALNLEELWLVDPDPERLEVFGGICKQLAREHGGSVIVHTTADPDAGLDGAGHVVAAIRVGGELGRAVDERIALDAGVLGQETTGAAGFAMALRSIPVLLDYAERIEHRTTGAWLFSFTNPAGLVTQALRDAGYERTVGICDGANMARKAVAAWHQLEERDLRGEVFGLNHLSWTRRVRLHDEDLLGPLLADEAFLASSRIRMFPPELVRTLGLWLNEYLYYFYYADDALAQVQRDKQTRGEEVLELTGRLLADLRSIGPNRDPAAALDVYRRYQRRRIATYMHYAYPDGPTMSEADQAASAPIEWAPAREEGYAGVTMDAILALTTGEPCYMALNVPNDGAIENLERTDVVEISCMVDGTGITPDVIGPLPAATRGLVHAVKAYERLTVQAIRERSRSLAIQALMAHPLVATFPRAVRLVDAFTAAHPEGIQWQAK